MRALSFALLTGLWPGSAWAFCGAYVGGTDGAPSNTASQIAVAWDGNATTLTLFNDFEGEWGDFGLLVPVPRGFDEGNVRLTDRGLLARLDAYSSPRLVSYTCEAFYDLDQDGEVASIATRTVSQSSLDQYTPADTGTSGSDSGSSSNTSASGCGSSGGSETWFDNDTGTDEEPVRVDTGNEVTVEEEFELGEYDAAVVTAATGEGLLGWLGDNGFTVDLATESLLDEYVDSGSSFLALRVNVERIPLEDGWLSPLQLGYKSTSLSLPLRLGTASSSGVQDLLLYVLVPPLDGSVGVANYPETVLPDGDCLLALDPDQDLSESWENTFEALSDLPSDPLDLGGRAGFTWTTEYSWDAGKCDPCTDDSPLAASDVTALGLYSFYGWHFTRLHLRYTPEAVNQDLSLYPTGILEQKQVRYVQHAWELESEIPTCGEVQPEDPGACYTSEYWARRAQAEEDLEELPVDDGFLVFAPFSGCRSDFGRSALLLPLLLAWRRRKTP